MKSLYFILLLLPFLVCTAQTSNTGYIVTKNNKKLTGKIVGIQKFPTYVILEFKNDFGTPYTIHPSLIRGFVSYNKQAFNTYESIHWKGLWLYLKTRYIGEYFRLLETPRFNSTGYSSVEDTTNTPQQFWITYPNGHIRPIRRIHFKRRIRHITREMAPQLTTLIGKRGYRYKNLPQILTACDLAYAKGIRRL